MKDALAPRAQEVPLAVEHHHGVTAPIERVHAIRRVDADRGHVGVELLSRRQLRPAVVDFVPIGSRAQDGRHVASLFELPPLTPVG